MVVANDGRDVIVGVNFTKDPLTDRGVLLHLPPLLKRERPFLAEKTGRESHFADVVDEAAEERSIALLWRKAHSARDVSAIDRNRTRVAGRVRVACLECRD